MLSNDARRRLGYSPAQLEEFDFSPQTILTQPLDVLIQGR
jgi:hypothetical protein